jgi:uncharacterized membrane protein YvbJ
MASTGLNIDSASARNILIIVSGIVVLLIVIVVFFKFSKSISNNIEDRQIAAALIESDNQDQSIATDSGVSKTRVTACRGIANNVAKSLNTHIDTPWYSYGEDESLTINLLNDARSDKEMILVSELYRTQSTDFRNLKADLRSKIFSSGINKIKYFYAL